MRKRLSEYILIKESAEEKVICCRKCEYVFCKAKDNYKNYALVKEGSLAKPGTLFEDSTRFVSREFYCPGCATMVDVEVCLKGAPFVWDCQLKVE